jgi:Bacteriophage head to tail connecting protein
VTAIAQDLIKQYDYLWSQQANFRQLWNTTAQYVMPAWDNFVGWIAEGVNRNSRIFDSTAVVANERFAAAMEQMLTPRTQVWHKLLPQDDALEDDPQVQQYLDQVNKILFSARYRPAANYASQVDECYMSLGAFGNCAMFVDERVGHGLRYRSVPLSEICWALDHAGMVDTVFRKFTMTAKQAVNQWGTKVGSKIQAIYDKNPYTDCEFLHCVRPNNDRKPGMPGPDGMAYECWYLSLIDNSVVEKAGYRSFPYAIGRYRMAPREHYGRGPATVALPHIRTLNEMRKTALRAGEKAVDPPILLAEDGVITPFNQRPGAVNYGMLSADGQPLAQPLQTAGSFQIGQELMEAEMGAINDSFLTSLFQILVQNPEMTATEALIRAQEKGAMIAPAMGRQQSEFLGPQILRELDILSAARVLPPPPPSMARSGQGIRIEYTSPLTRAMRAEEGTAIMNTIQSLGIMANLDKSVLQLFDFVAAAREMALINGTPAKLLRSDEEVDQLLQQQQQAEQGQQIVQGAPQVSMAAKNLAQAQQALAASGGGAGPAIPAPGASNAAA